MGILTALRGVLWSFVFIPLFFVTGAFCFFLLPGRKKSEGKSRGGGVSPLRALLMNLGSTIGTGNIVGVSLAIASGGAGSVFWMWAAALVGMCVSYAENMLGVKHRRENNYPVPYMKKRLAKIFSVFCVLSSLGMGNMAQSNSAAEAAKSAFNMPHALTGALLALLTAAIIFRGLGGILRFTDKFVPLMALFYIFSSLGVIYVCRGALGEVMRDIFREAFSVKAITGGTAAVGIARGVFSGEAGLGSSVILSSTSNAKSPETQGFVGMTGIFLDTFVMCSLTALAILTSKSVSASGAFYKTLGSFGGGALNMSLIFFAFTTIIGWSYYGEVCSAFLLGKSAKLVYKIFFVLFVFIGAVTRAEAVWCLSDIFNVMMALPNMISVISALRREKR